MTSSQDMAEYYFRSRRRKPAEVGQVFPVSRLRKCHQVPEKNVEGHGLRFKGHPQRRCGWSEGDLWPLIGQSVLVCLLAIIGQCQATGQSGRDLQHLSLIQLGNCRALVNHNVIDLERLRRGNVSHRYACNQRPSTPTQPSTLCGAVK